MNANRESLEKIHGKDKAEAAFNEIRDLGGFGNVPFDYVGGLDVYSAVELGNTAIPEKDKDRIAKLAGINRKEADALFDSGKVITASEVQDNRVGGKG